MSPRTLIMNRAGTAAAALAVLATPFAAGAARAGAVPIPAASHTVEWSGAPASTVPNGSAPAAAAAGDPAAASRSGPVLAQAPINAGPLQGPLASGGGGAAAPRCGCPPVRHVVHRRRVNRAAPPPVTVAALPPRPAYAYPPLIYRPVVPVYAYRPIYPAYPYVYRPYVYRPYGYRPFFFRRGFYGY